MGCYGTFLCSGMRTPVARGHRPLVPLVRLHSSVAVSCFALIILRWRSRVTPHMQVISALWLCSG